MIAACNKFYNQRTQLAEDTLWALMKRPFLAVSLTEPGRDGS